jgi:DNA recombination protein RmuC
MQKISSIYFPTNLINSRRRNEQKFDKLQENEIQLKEFRRNSKSLRNAPHVTKSYTILWKKIGESFKIVESGSKALREGLGEMRILAVGVGDLKKVWTNVKTRGTGEKFNLKVNRANPSRRQYPKTFPTKRKQ